MTDVGAQIRNARKASNLSQSELGNRIGRTSKTVRRYEQGKTTPDTNILGMIADATDHPIEFFLTSDGGPEGGGRTSLRRPPGATAVALLPMVRIDGSQLIETGVRKDVPQVYLRRVGLDPENACLLRIPTGHYSLRRQLGPSSTLVLEPLTEPTSLDAYIAAERFVDGRYVVDIGNAGLQIKELTARPDGTVSVASLDAAQRFRCPPKEQDGITIHATVALSF